LEFSKSALLRIEENRRKQVSAAPKNGLFRILVVEQTLHKTSLL
jgi:hypothetical protein